VSDSINLQVWHVDYAADTHIVTAQVQLMNKGDAPVRGALSLFGVGIHSDFGVPAPLNATGAREGQPFWDLSGVIPAEGLGPKATSKPLEMKFKIDAFHAAPRGDAVAMRIQVLQKN